MDRGSVTPRRRVTESAAARPTSGVPAEAPVLLRLPDINPSAEGDAAVGRLTAGVVGNAHVGTIPQPPAGVAKAPESQAKSAAPAPKASSTNATASPAAAAAANKSAAPPAPGGNPGRDLNSHIFRIVLIVLFVSSLFLMYEKHRKASVVQKSSGPAADELKIDAQLVTEAPSPMATPRVAARPQPEGQPARQQAPATAPSPVPAQSSDPAHDELEGPSFGHTHPSAAAYAQPASATEPVGGNSAREQNAAYSTAVQGGTAYDQPAHYNSGTYETSAAKHPAYDRAAYETPAYDATAYETPAYDRTAYEQPAYDNTAYDNYGASSAEAAARPEVPPYVPVTLRPRADDNSTNPAPAPRF